MFIRSFLLLSSVLLSVSTSYPLEAKRMETSIEIEVEEVTNNSSQLQQSKSTSVPSSQYDVVRMGIPLPGPLPEIPWWIIVLPAGGYVVYLLSCFILNSLERVPGDSAIIVERTGKPEKAKFAADTNTPAYRSRSVELPSLSLIQTMNPAKSGFVQTQGLFWTWRWDHIVEIISVPFAINAFSTSNEDETGKLGTKDNLQIDVVIDINLQVVDPWRFNYQAGEDPFQEVADLLDDPIRRVFRTLTYHHAENMGGIELLNRLGLMIIPAGTFQVNKNETNEEYVDSMFNVKNTITEAKLRSTATDESNSTNGGKVTGDQKITQLRDNLWQKMEEHEEQSPLSKGDDSESEDTSTKKLQPQYQNDPQYFQEELEQEGERLMQTFLNNGIRLEPPYIQFKDIIPPRDYRNALAQQAIARENRKAELAQKQTEFQLAQEETRLQTQRNKTVQAKYEGYKTAQTKTGFDIEFAEIKAPLYEKIGENNRVVIGTPNMKDFFSLMDEYNQDNQSQNQQNQSSETNETNQSS